MRYFYIFVLVTICSLASAKGNTITPEFIELLKKNNYEKSRGTNIPERFLSSVKSIADKGDPSAQFVYGVALFKGNPSAAKQYLSQSAVAGCAGSEAMLATIYMIEKNREKGVNLFKSSARKGDASAQIAIAGFYKRGTDGFDKSAEKQYAWLMLAQRQTFSNGALAAIEKGMSELSLTDIELRKANVEFEILSKQIIKQDYYLCGQINVDTSRSPSIESYLKI